MVVHLLSLTNFKFFSKQAEEALDGAYHKLGSVDDLFAVFKEAENTFMKTRKPYSAVKALASGISAAASSAVTHAPKPVPLNTSAKNPVSNSNSTNKNQFGIYKTKICEHWKNNRKCPHGVYCLFAHGNGELRTAPVAQVNRIFNFMIMHFQPASLYIILYIFGLLIILTFCFRLHPLNLPHTPITKLFYAATLKQMEHVHGVIRVYLLMVKKS